MTKPILPQALQDIDDANRDRVSFSDIKNSHGAAGKTVPMTLLEKQPIIIPPHNTPLEIDLSWDHRHQNKGFLGQIRRMMGKGQVDLDLGCLYELKNGQKGCIQSFGNLFGSLDSAPFIALSGDERSGAALGADESLTINSHHWADIDRLLVYAYIYNGIPDWASLRVECTLRHGNDSPIFLSLKEEEDHLPICALLMIDNENNHMRVTRRVEYFNGHPELDRAYGFGLSWEEGQK